MHVASAACIGVWAGGWEGCSPPPQSGKTGENFGQVVGQRDVLVDIDLHEVTMSAYRFATLRFGPIQQRCAANVKLRCNIIDLRSVNELTSQQTPCNLQ